MRKTGVLLALLLTFSLAQSCDFFRHIAGRPDSAWIRAKGARIELARRNDYLERLRLDSLEQVRLDSVARAERAAADSVHFVDSLLKAGKLRKASDVRSIPSSWLNARWGLVVGAFSNDANARKLASKYEASGFATRIYRTRGGLNILLVAPCSNVSETIDAYRGTRHLPFASKETWVIVNE